MVCCFLQALGFPRPGIGISACIGLPTTEMFQCFFLVISAQTCFYCASEVYSVKSTVVYHPNMSVFVIDFFAFCPRIHPCRIEVLFLIIKDLLFWQFQTPQKGSGPIGALIELTMGKLSFLIFNFHLLQCLNAIPNSSLLPMKKMPLRHLSRWVFFCQQYSAF